MRAAAAGPDAGAGGGDRGTERGGGAFGGGGATQARDACDGDRTYRDGNRQGGRVAAAADVWWLGGQARAQESVEGPRGR